MNFNIECAREADSFKPKPSRLGLIQALTQ